MSQAVTLARWIRSGRRPVTPGQVLRKADVPAAGTALRVDVPARLRTMADIRELHRPWCAAVATGLLQVSDGSVTAGPALESRSRGITVRFTPSAWRSAATPPSSTGPKRSQRNQQRSV
jgi:hypothetical protein